jgi:DsbC/DsbD-like thiol-disulfide interchange protein
MNSRRIAVFAGMTFPLFAAYCLPWGTAQEESQKSDKEIKASVKAERPDADGKQKIELTLMVNKGWYIYANPVGNEDLASNATTVTVNPKPASVEISYPAGKEKKDKIVGDYRIYEDKVVIPLQIRRAAGDNAALELTVRVNACNVKGFCLPPGTTKVTVP